MPEPLPILAPLPPHWQASNARHVASLAPAFRADAEALVAAAWARGLPVVIVQSRRTDAQQLALWRQGRETRGPNASAARPFGSTVTEARTAHDTPHGAGLAVDLAFLVDGRLVSSAAPDGGSWSASLPWGDLGAVVESQGLAWGGRFPHPDRPHAQHPRWRELRS